MKRFAQITVLILTWLIIPATLLLIIGNLYAKQRIYTLKANSLRSHDKYTTGEKYVANINSSEVNYLGDICTQSGYLTGKDCPFWDGDRKHHFQSDNLGFKTLGNFENSEVVIIGDSFLGAIGGDDTKDQLGAVIAKETGKKIY